ncbi:hypothetical protein ACPEEZ_14965 [Frigoribacterium sp. 2-23]|uniref:hypothetical protein n=1 Tax=Frigoribacterium sp. 2-23 TaxID=3415006 RepID=UPI003C6F546C
MTSSNRFLNRLFVLVVGVISLAVGATLIVFALPAAGFARDWLDSARSAVADTLKSTPLDPTGGSGGSWLPLALAALCLVLLVLFVWAMFAHGHGRTDRVLVADEPAGSIAISAKFADNAITDALESRRDVASVSVSAWTVRREPALKVRVRVTAGSAPGPVVSAASDVVRGLDRVLGQTVPVLVEVVGAPAQTRTASSRVA